MNQRVTKQRYTTVCYQMNRRKILLRIIPNGHAANTSVDLFWPAASTNTNRYKRYENFHNFMNLLILWMCYPYMHFLHCEGVNIFNLMRKLLNLKYMMYLIDNFFIMLLCRFLCTICQVYREWMTDLAVFWTTTI